MLTLNHLSLFPNVKLNHTLLCSRSTNYAKKITVAFLYVREIVYKDYIYYFVMFQSCNLKLIFFYFGAKTLKTISKNFRKRFSSMD